MMNRNVRSAARERGSIKWSLRRGKKMSGRQSPVRGLRIGFSATSWGIVTAMGLAVCLLPSASEADYSEPVVGVQEDWVLVLYEPNDALTAPQFYTVMSPFGHLDSMFAQVTWNYRELPDFSSGGLQIQGWNGESLLTAKSFDSQKLSTSAETVTWTQTLQTDGTKVSFAIHNGQSTTWGSFGYPAQNMKIQGAASLPNLNGYNPNFSAAKSGVSFGSNRVGSLKIVEVRYYGPSGLLGVDTSPKVVFELD